MRTVVLLSGGLDSATVLAWCLDQGDECMAIGFDYDQPHHIELDRAESIASYYGVSFRRIGLPAMLNAKVDDVVFPGRNLVLAALAISLAQSLKFDRIAVGCNSTDWLRFPDCRPDFWNAVQGCADAYGIRVARPLINMSKREVVEMARKLNVPIDKTWSCYSPRDATPCGECLACTTRQEALA